MSEVIIYHDNCHDGITALWCALQAYPDAEPYPAKYDIQPDIERLRGRDVYVVDFSWKRPEMLAILDACEYLTVIDHHKTAEAELADFPGGDIYFDMSRSGAGMAWDILVGGARPPLVSYVEDRDLWRFALPGSREVHAACNTYPLDLESREFLMRQDILALRKEGEAVLRYHDKLVESAARHSLREMIGGHDVPSIACPNAELVSDLGHRLAQGEPFSAVWVDQADGTRKYSLRSTAEGADVSEIARAHGGGGHRNAAGFTRRFYGPSTTP